jgi:hypothetical protein
VSVHHPRKVLGLADIRQLIEQARGTVAQAVNAALGVHYWQVGKRIRRDILKSKRAAYGEGIVSTLSRRLSAEYGSGYSRPNLFRMIRFAEVFPDREIVSTLSRPLSWSHFTEIIALKDELQRDFYAEMCRIERWGVRTLRAKIGGMLFERTALSRKPAALVKQEIANLRAGDTLTPDLVFRDPYFLDFLGLKDAYRRPRRAGRGDGSASAVETQGTRPALHRCKRHVGIGPVDVISIARELAVELRGPGGCLAFPPWANCVRDF